MMSLTRSLRGRIAIATFCLVALVLTSAGLVLHRALERFVDQTFLDRLESVALGLLAVIELDDNDDIVLLRDIGDAAFERVRSGWYWQISINSEPIATSRSLWLDALDEPMSEPQTIHDFPGPADQRLLAYVHRGFAPGLDDPLTIIVTAPETEIDRHLASIVRPLLVALGLLAIVLTLSAVAVVHYTTRPLAATRRALEQLRRGKTTRVIGPIPLELEPLIDDLHSLLDHSAALVKRSREHLADLAHALKTPLAVVRQQLDALPADQRDGIEPALEQVERLITRHLKRARAAGAQRLLGQHTPVHDVLAPFGDWVAHLRQRHPVAWILDLDARLVFAGDHADLEEMLGNLIENAAKWARSTIRVHGQRVDDTIRISVEDDGPGMDEALIQEALKRGVRLDESVEGSGLGLAIVRDLVALYDGRLTLANRDPHGLIATVQLPAA